MKSCISCRMEKPVTEFYVHPQMADGHLGKCKECCKRDVAANIAKRSLEPQWRANERKRGREKMKLRRALGIPEKVNGNYNKNWRRSNKHKVRAHSADAWAAKKGKIVKPDFCEGCSKNAKLDKHHPDYSQPLYVVWLCKACHGKAHQKAFGS